MRDFRFISNELDEKQRLPLNPSLIRLRQHFLPFEKLCHCEYCHSGKSAAVQSGRNLWRALRLRSDGSAVLTPLSAKDPSS